MISRYPLHAMFIAILALAASAAVVMTTVQKASADKAATSNPAHFGVFDEPDTAPDIATAALADPHSPVNGLTDVTSRLSARSDAGAVRIIRARMDTVSVLCSSVEIGNGIGAIGCTDQTDSVMPTVTKSDAGWVVSGIVPDDFQRLTIDLKDGSTVRPTLARNGFIAEVTTPPQRVSFVLPNGRSDYKPVMTP